MMMQRRPESQALRSEVCALKQLPQTRQNSCLFSFLGLRGVFWRSRGCLGDGGIEDDGKRGRIAILGQWEMDTVEGFERDLEEISTLNAGKSSWSACANSRVRSMYMVFRKTSGRNQGSCHRRICY